MTISTGESGHGSAAARAYAVRVAIFYAAVFLVAGAQMPFLPVWLDWNGLTASEISVVAAVPLIVRIIVTPAFAFLADRHGDHRLALIALSWAGFAMLLLLTRAGGFWPILISATLFALFWTSVMPLTETIALNGVRRAGLDYGRMRIWGSISFIAASFGGGFILEWTGNAFAIWLIVAGGLATVIGAHLLPQPGSLPNTTAGAAASATARKGLRLDEALALLSNRAFLTFLLAVGSIQAAHAVIYTYGTLHWQSQKITSATAGMLWTIGVIAEIMLFAWSKAIVARLGPMLLIAIGGVAAVVRWTIMAFDPPVALLVPLQILHALTFGATHLGAVHHIAATISERQGATAQAVTAAVTAGIAMGGATLLSGRFYEAFQGRAYLAMAALGAIGLAAALVLRRAR
ncbi:MAG TPA: MFS transporter [Hyphomicrobiaceae bacterium]|nr:MFS transporter [Hyphomicrobiaceae bacterium]